MADDPEGADVYAQCLAQWRDLPPAVRARVLLADPLDLSAFGAAVRGLLDDPARATRLGAAGRAHVRQDYVGDVHLLRYARLFDTIAHPGGD